MEAERAHKVNIFFYIKKILLISKISDDLKIRGAKN